MLKNLPTISKAIAGAAATTVGAMTTFIVIPPEVQMPWWGYFGVGFANALLGLLVVYVAPKNRE